VFNYSDHLGSSRALTDINGHPCYDADYYLFGAEKVITNTCSQHFKFADMYRDTETGLDHTWFRQYSSNTGRWVSPDPARGNPLNPQSWNRYAYVLNNPLNLTDRLGLTGNSAACLLAPRAMISGATSGCGGIYEGGSGGVSIDNGAPIPGGLFGEGGPGGGESAVECPGGVCSGFGTNANGDTAWVEFTATAGGVTGYYNPLDLANGIYEYGGQLYNSAN